MLRHNPFVLNRYDYVKGALDEEALLDSPTQQLQRWLDEATNAGVTEPLAMCLSTVGRDLRPSSRFVLLRGLDESGLMFYTNYESHKAQQMAENPYVSVTFWWAAMERQVRVEGRVEKVAESDSDAYFASRPRESQLASAASPQSRPVKDREELEGLVQALEAEVGGGEIRRPATWGGYRLVPDRYEFWQGRAARLHDRLVYVPEQDGWRIQRLAP